MTQDPLDPGRGLEGPFRKRDAGERKRESLLEKKEDEERGLFLLRRGKESPQGNGHKPSSNNVVTAEERPEGRQEEADAVQAVARRRKSFQAPLR
jgi:hypothetical protein